MSIDTPAPDNRSAQERFFNRDSSTVMPERGSLPWLPPLSQWSLRLRLCLFFLLILITAWAFALLLAWKECKEYIDEFYDTQQILFAKRLASANLSNITDRLPSTKFALRGDETVEKGEFEDDALAFAVFSADGEAILTDGQKGDDIIYQNSVTGFIVTNIYGSKDPWRIVWLPSTDGDFTIAVGQELEYRDDMALDMLAELIYPWILLIPLLIVGFFWILSRELSPLRNLTYGLESRRAGETGPLELERTPPEIRFIVQALNSLFSRTGDLLMRERAFISDAAHELRTPLTALRIQAEVIGLAMNNPAALEHALEKMLHGIDKSTQLVEQLLTLSRLEAIQDTKHTEFGLRKVDWLSTLDELVLEHRTRAEKKGIILKCAVLAEPAVTSAYPVLIALLLRNLLDNAVKYTPDNGDITITLDDSSLVIENSGPGVPDSFVSKLGERFARPPGQASPGSGLGLSIAKRAADINGLTLSLQNRLGVTGFIARVIFR